VSSCFGETGRCKWGVGAGNRGRARAGSLGEEEASSAGLFCLEALGWAYGRHLKGPRPRPRPRPSHHRLVVADGY